MPPTHTSGRGRVAGHRGPVAPSIERWTVMARATMPNPSKKFFVLRSPGRTIASIPEQRLLAGPGHDGRPAGPPRRPPSGRRPRRRGRSRPRAGCRWRPGRTQRRSRPSRGPGSPRAPSRRRGRGRHAATRPEGTAGRRGRGTPIPRAALPCARGRATPAGRGRGGRRPVRSVPTRRGRSPDGGDHAASSCAIRLRIVCRRRCDSSYCWIAARSSGDSAASRGTTCDAARLS